MRKPEPTEIVAIALPIFAAEAVVAVGLFLGAAITVNGHSIYAVLLGWL